MEQDTADENIVFPNVLLQKRDHIATLIVNWPRGVDDLDLDTTVDIITALENARDDTDIYALIILGARDKVIAAGGDVVYAEFGRPGRMQVRRNLDETKRRDG